MKTIIKLSISIIAVVLLLIGYTSQSKAQCPTTFPTGFPTTPGWTFGECYLQSIHGCDYTVCWCFRVLTDPDPAIGTYIQYTISSITPVDPTCANSSGVTMNELINTAMPKVLTDDRIQAVVTSTTIPPCDLDHHGKWVVVALRGTCWGSEDIYISGHWLTKIVPCDVDLWCMANYFVCIDGSGHIYIDHNGGTSIVGGGTNWCEDHGDDSVNFPLIAPPMNPPHVGIYNCTKTQCGE
jgi:hypothetical protein